MMKRKLMMSAAAVLLAATAAPAMADHSRVAVSVSYGPTVVRYVDHGWYWNGYRYVRYDRRYDGRYDRRVERRYRDDRTWYPATSKRKSKKKSKNDYRYRRHSDWCPIERGHWH